MVPPAAHFLKKVGQKLLFARQVQMFSMGDNISNMER
jgi:hypothetical protein